MSYIFSLDDLSILCQLQTLRLSYLQWYEGEAVSIVMILAVEIFTQKRLVQVLSP